jgi:hypothetical protein
LIFVYIPQEEGFINTQRRAIDTDTDIDTVTMFGSKKSNSSGMFTRDIKVDELKTLAQVFKDKCIKSQLEIPSKVMTEFAYRIKQATQGESKPKLNFNRAGIDTQYTVLLVETLAASPLIAKLELRGNDLTDKAAMYLLRLLKGQMKLMKVPADRRLHGVFLGSVDLSDNSEEIDPKILNGISTVR